MIQVIYHFLEGFAVAKRNNRYRKLDTFMTRVILGDAFLFLVYLLCAALGIGFLKITAAIFIILGSALGIGYLFLTQELLKVRSRWMSLSFASLILLTIVSLICKVPFGPVA